MATPYKFELYYKDPKPLGVNLMQRPLVPRPGGWFVRLMDIDVPGVPEQLHIWGPFADQAQAEEVKQQLAADALREFAPAVTDGEGE